MVLPFLDPYLFGSFFSILCLSGHLTLRHGKESKTKQVFRKKSRLLALLDCLKLLLRYKPYLKICKTM